MPPGSRSAFAGRRPATTPTLPPSWWSRASTRSRSIPTASRSPSRMSPRPRGVWPEARIGDRARYPYNEAGAMKIAVFETEEWEHAACLRLRPGHEVICTREPVNEGSVERYADAEVVSPFVNSRLGADV